MRSGAPTSPRSDQAYSASPRAALSPTDRPHIDHSPPGASTLVVYKGLPRRFRALPFDLGWPREELRPWLRRAGPDAAAAAIGEELGNDEIRRLCHRTLQRVDDDFECCDVAHLLQLAAEQLEADVRMHRSLDGAALALVACGIAIACEATAAGAVGRARATWPTPLSVPPPPSPARPGAAPDCVAAHGCGDSLDQPSAQLSAHPAAVAHGGDADVVAADEDPGDGHSESPKYVPLSWPCRAERHVLRNPVENDPHHHPSLKTPADFARETAEALPAEAITATVVATAASAQVAAPAVAADAAAAMAPVQVAVPVVAAGAAAAARLAASASADAAACDGLAATAAADAADTAADADATDAAPALTAWSSADYNADMSSDDSDRMRSTDRMLCKHAEFMRQQQDLQKRKRKAERQRVAREAKAAEHAARRPDPARDVGAAYADTELDSMLECRREAKAGEAAAHEALQARVRREMETAMDTGVHADPVLALAFGVEMPPHMTPASDAAAVPDTEL